jgi:hypothetical protein
MPVIIHSLHSAAACTLATLLCIVANNVSVFSDTELQAFKDTVTDRQGVCVNSLS